MKGTLEDREQQPGLRLGVSKAESPGWFLLGNKNNEDIFAKDLGIDKKWKNKRSLGTGEGHLGELSRRPATSE